jgi:hypothetical protein
LATEGGLTDVCLEIWTGIDSGTGIGIGIGIGEGRSG